MLYVVMRCGLMAYFITLLCCKISKRFCFVLFTLLFSSNMRAFVLVLTCCVCVSATVYVMLQQSTPSTNPAGHLNQSDIANPGKPIGTALSLHAHLLDSPIRSRAWPHHGPLAARGWPEAGGRGAAKRRDLSQVTA